jgi:hypothetical protein
MKLEDARSAYEALSGKASDIVRQLSLAAVALVWVFKTGTGTSFVLEPRLRKGIAFVFAALFLDLLQYLVGTATWHIYFRHKERTQTGAEDEFRAPSRINWPTWTLFWMKAAAMLISYGWFILPFLIGKIATG